MTYSNPGFRARRCHQRAASSSEHPTTIAPPSLASRLFSPTSHVGRRSPQLPCLSIRRCCRRSPRRASLDDAMAKRDRTPLFLQLRASTQASASPAFLHARPLSGAPSAARGGVAGGNSSGSNGTELVSLKRASTGDPPDPEWVSRYYALVAALEGVRADHAALADAQARHLLPAFGEDDTAAAEQAIASSTRALTAALHAAERELRALEPDGHGATEARVVENIKRALAGTLQAASLAFRADQKEYMVKLQGMKDAVGVPARGGGARAGRGRRRLGGSGSGGRGGRGDAGGTVRPSPYDDPAAGGVVEGEDAVLLELEMETDLYDTGFDDAQTAEAAAARRRAEMRAAELTDVAASVTELAVMVRDLAALVIDQGSVLDRVDYNVEAVRADTGRAVGQLRRAERAQRARASFWCLLCLAIGCGIMASALLLKWLF